MSSREAATVKPARRSTAARPKAAAAKAAAVKPAPAQSVSVTATTDAPHGSASANAAQLAATIERDLREGRLDTLTPEAFQALMAALCKSYGSQIEAGAQFMPIADRSAVSPTEVMTTTSALLKAANLAVFELGMWQSWTGR